MQSIPILRQARDYPCTVCVPLQPATLSRLLFQAKLEDDAFFLSVSQPEYAEQTEGRLAKFKSGMVFEIASENAQQVFMCQETEQPFQIFSIIL